MEERNSSPARSKRTERSGIALRIVVSRFNSFITERLLSAAVDALERAGARSNDVDVVHFPAHSNCRWRRKNWPRPRKYDALIAIGCILRGETAHSITFARKLHAALQLAQMDSACRSRFAC